MQGDAQGHQRLWEQEGAPPAPAGALGPGGLSSGPASEASP